MPPASGIRTPPAGGEHHGEAAGSFALGRGPWPPLRRAVLDAMKDGEPHWGTELSRQLGQRRRNHVVGTLHWLVRHGFAARSGKVTVEGDRSEDAWALTTHGLEHAGNLDAGYGPADYRQPYIPPADPTHTGNTVSARSLSATQ
ncbi:hypothetical protein [Nocardia wallacei]|uniref:hypothetical protein n=1 Tax=Nocardia wallacei TaxID=480035 RepID=UPI0024541626|nr:hypothetical protein [Nocardia wallacei]